MGDVRRAESAAAAAPGSGAISAGPEAGFLRQLAAERIVQTPRPLRLDGGRPGEVFILLASDQPLPPSASVIPLYCKLLGRDGRAVAEARGTWHPTFVVSTTFALTVPAGGADMIELHVNPGRPGARVLSRPLEVEVRDEREAIKTKLIGLEDAYRQYRDYRGALGRVSLANRDVRADFQMAAERQGRDVEHLLQRHGFASTADFEGHIDRFEQAFEQEAAALTRDLLQQYAARMQREAARYQDPAQVAELHSRLELFRFEHAEFERDATTWNSYKHDSERSRIPGNAQLRPTIGPREADAARTRASEAKAAAQDAFQGLAAEYPIFDEAGLPDDRRLDKTALAKADERQLATLLRAQTARRAKDVAEALAQLTAEPSLIYKLDRLLPHFYERQGIAPGSIYDLIIRDKQRQDEITKLVVGVLVAVAAIALSVLSAGTATPAIAAAAGVAGAGLGAYSAYTEYQDHSQQQALADVGLADDPSTAWLTLAILGAGFDAGVALNALKSLGPAARALHAGGDLDAFTQTVAALEKAGALESRLALTASKAAAAKREATEIFDALLIEFSSKIGMGPGVFNDPTFRRLLMDLAIAKTKHGFYSSQMFIDELRRVRTMAKLGDLTPEELASAKDAWEEALAEIKPGAKPAPLQSLRNSVESGEEKARAAASEPVEQRRRALGTGPKGDYKEHEGEVAILIEKDYGYFVRDTHVGSEWISLSGPYEGKTFDLLGIPENAIRHHGDDLKGFLPSVDSHFRKSIDFVVLDRRFMTPGQRATLDAYIDSRYASHKHRLITLDK